MYPPEMGTPFDHIASAYDADFSRSAIGQWQRRQVWQYIESIIPQLRGMEMLELNCGTGEDAMMFSEKGFNIVATDVSEEMLKITRQKAQQYSMQSRISSHYLDLESFDETMFDKKFDLIFSNFGGLNCINPQALQRLLQKLPALLTPGGRFIAVIMPKFCWWESWYFLAKLQWKNIFRRWTNEDVPANLNGVIQKTWYFHPAEVRRWARHHFITRSTHPIGMMLPPSYLETFFAKHPRWLRRLGKWEQACRNMSWLSGMSDHFIIDLQVK